MSDTKIGWMGLGKCGLPIAEKIGSMCNVISYDIIEKATTHTKFTNDISDMLFTDIVFILVQTPHADPSLDGSVHVDLRNTADFDYTALKSSLTLLDDINYRNPVVISSTVSPGTIRKIAADFENLSLVYMPVMIQIGSVASDYIAAPMYYIGSHDGSKFEFVETVLRKFVKTDTFLYGTWEEVELYKMMGNIFSSIKIAFANNISEMIEYGNLNASSWNVMTALLHDTKNFNSPAYLMPGSGNGGPCHPRDGVVLSWLTDQVSMESQFLKHVTDTRQQQAYALAKHLVSYQLPIVILGKSFKKGVDLTVGSYSVLVGNYCKELNAEVTYDTASDKKSVILLAHPDTTLLTSHAPTTDSIIVDLWNLGITSYNVKVWGNNRT